MEAQVVTLEPMRRSTIRRAASRGRRLLRSLIWRHRLGHFGRGSSLDRPTLITGGASIRIGDGVHIWRGARLEAFNARPGVTRITVEAGTVIQPHVHIGSCLSVRIGERALLASNVYISDHDHDYRDPSDPVVSNRRLLAAAVVIEDEVWLGERVTVLKGVTIGRGSIVGAGSVVTADVPPFCIAVGSPARIIRTFCHERQTWLRAA